MVVIKQRSLFKNINTCLFTLPLLSTQCLMMRIAELVCLLLSTQKNRSGRPAGAGGKCSMFSASHKQCLQNRGETSSGPVLKPRPQPGDACGIPESASQMKLPLCHKCRATAALALSAKPQGMISFERERCIHQDFTAEVPSLSPSPRPVSAVAPQHPLLSVHVCVGACGTCSSPWACAAGGTALSCGGVKQQKLRDALPRCSLLTPAQTANVPTGTWSKSGWREVQREWRHWRWHYEATEPSLHQHFHLVLFCFETNMSWADTENKIRPCIQLLR